MPEPDELDKKLSEIAQITQGDVSKAIAQARGAVAKILKPKDDNEPKT